MSFLTENKSLYSRYINMIHRCNNENFYNYHHYGGRGITICDEWLRGFQYFYQWAISSGYQEGLQIDRIDNNGNYNSLNCRWVTGKENTRNRRRTVTITFEGQTKSVAEWAEITGMPYDCLFLRVKRTNWTAEQIIKTPVGARKYGSHPRNQRFTRVSRKMALLKSRKTAFLIT